MFLSTFCWFKLIIATHSWLVYFCEPEKFFSFVCQELVAFSQNHFCPYLKWKYPKSQKQKSFALEPQNRFFSAQNRSTLIFLYPCLPLLNITLYKIEKKIVPELPVWHLIGIDIPIGWMDLPSIMRPCNTHFPPTYDTRVRV